MKRLFHSLALLVMLACGLYYLAGLITDLRHFSRYSADQLLNLSRQIDVEWGQSQGRGASQGTLAKLRRERQLLDAELAIRRYHLDAAAGVLGGAAFLYILWAWIGAGRVEMSRARRRAVEDFRILELKPGEEYVDEYEYFRRAETGLPDREDAIRWLQTDRANRCEYCGGEMLSPAGKDKSAVQLITFYKRVPEGAKDLRVIIGSLWFARQAPEVVCDSCGNRVSR